MCVLCAFQFSGAGCVIARSAFVIGNLLFSAQNDIMKYVCAAHTYTHTQREREGKSR